MALLDCPLNCGRKHKSGHPHLEAEPEDNAPRVRVQSEESAPRQQTPTSVLGADSPDTLASQAAQLGSKRGVTVKTKAEREAETLAARMEATRPLARKLATAPYVVIAIATFDDEWMKIAQEEVDALEAATLNTMMAWGIEFSGKWSSISALAILHAQVIGMKLREKFRLEAIEKEAEARRNAVTQNAGDVN